MLVAGEEFGKPVVMSLVRDTVFEAVDLGRLEGARLLEPLALIWIELARVRGLGPNISFNLQRKAPV